MVCLIHGHACFHHYYSSALCMLCVVCCMLYVVCCAAAAGLLVEHEAMEKDCTVHYSGCHDTEGVPHLYLSYLIIMNPPIISDLETSNSLSIATKHLSCLGKHRLDTYLQLLPLNRRLAINRLSHHDIHCSTLHSYSQSQSYPMCLFDLGVICV